MNEDFLRGRRKRTVLVEELAFGVAIDTNAWVETNGITTPSDVVVS